MKGGVFYESMFLLKVGIKDVPICMTFLVPESSAHQRDLLYFCGSDTSTPGDWFTGWGSSMLQNCLYLKIGPE